MKVFITGGSGFLGEHLARAFVENGHAVTILDPIAPSKTAAVVEYINGDVRDREAVRRACAGADVVIHNAALVPLTRGGDLFWDVNVNGTKTVLEVAKELCVRKVIFISSSSVYGIPENGAVITEETKLNPFEAYGKSKAAAEEVCQSFKKDLDVSILRPRTILGPGRMGLMSLLFDWVASNQRVYILGKGDNRYQLVAASDLCDAVLRMATQSCKGEDFNIGTPRFGALREDLEEFIKRSGSGSRVTSVPGFLARMTLPILGFLRLSPLVGYQYHIADRSVSFSVDKLQRVLGFMPQKSNAEMLHETYQWYVKHKDEAKSGSAHKTSLKKGALKLLGVVDFFFLLRPAQWIKNFFVMAPLALSTKLTSPDAMWMSVYAFVLFCFASSTVYIWNDVIDCKRDQEHPTKKFRPIACGQVSIRNALILGFFLGSFALIAGYLLDERFGIVIVAYFLLNVFYSLWLKHIALIDLFAIASNYVLRVVAGTLVIHEPVTSWVIILTTLLALFLALGKRRSELVTLQDRAEHHRASLRHYSLPFLDQLIVIISASIVMAWTLYTLDPTIQARFHSNLLPVTVPIVLYGLFRYGYLVHQKGEGESPTHTFLADRPLLLTVGLWFIVIFSLRFLS
ncbi:MAG: decaprenyl-phosphate phosphoribosyltransferase [Patescibacteria group bacterium]|jgi:nucleoside-diphosphate-sugar epimerase/4-hydroxybenzoate polyprenyltransferase